MVMTVQLYTADELLELGDDCRCELVKNDEELSGFTLEVSGVFAQSEERETY